MEPKSRHARHTVDISILRELFSKAEKTDLGGASQVIPELHNAE
jgi:hypothetical protein